jgi:hypothetical protein
MNDKSDETLGWWGVIRYSLGDDTTDFDGLHAVFDGWYSSKTDALGIVSLYRKSHPKHTVVLMQSHAVDEAALAPDDGPE